MWGSFRLGDGHIEFGKLQIPGLFVPRRHDQSLNLAPRLAARPRRLFAAERLPPPLGPSPLPHTRHTPPTTCPRPPPRPCVPPPPPPAATTPRLPSPPVSDEPPSPPP